MGRPGLTQHRKFRRLARLIRSAPLARGCLEMIWDTAYESGDPYLGDTEDVEAAAQWTGKPGILCAALLDAGFIEPDPDREPDVAGYMVHDLFDHAPRYVRDRLQREQERRASGKTISDIRREAVQLRRDRQQTPTNGQQTPTNGRSFVESEHQLRAHSATNAKAPAPAPAPKALSQSRRPGRSAGDSWPLAEAVEAAYQRYPRKEGKAPGMKRLRSLLRTPEDAQRFAAAVDGYAALVAGKDREYVKHFSTFAGCWEDYAPGAPAVVEAVDPDEERQIVLAEEARQRKIAALRITEPDLFGPDGELLPENRA